MIGAIAGDIIGSRFEGHLSPPPDFELFHAGCRFTDDTVCSLAVAAALLGDEDFAAALRRLVRRYPRAGYGGLFLSWAMADDAPRSASAAIRTRWPASRALWRKRSTGYRAGSPRKPGNSFRRI